MRVPWPNFCGGSNVSQSSIADAQQTVNWYPEPRDVPGGKTAMALYPTPGVETRVTAIETPGRALFHQNGRCFTVIGATFYEVFDAGGGVFTLTNRGTVAVDANPATICGNGDGGGQLFITSGDVGYSYDLTTDTLAVERASGNTMCAMLDGYILVLDSATSTVYVSDLFDATTWDPTQYAQRSTAPDRWVALVVPKSAREIWLLGDETSEVWNNAGTFPFPFVPIPGALLAHGCAAPFSAKEVEGGVLWLSKTADGQGAVVLATGGAPRPVSTFAFEWASHGYTTIDDAIGAGYRAAGHTFYLVTLPTEDVTWALDLSTKMWTTRGTWVSASNAYVAWRPRYHAFAFGVHVALDGVTGALYEVSESYGYDVDGLPIRRMRRPPALFNDHATIFLSCVEVILESGLGTYSGRGVDPVMEMRLSRDGGKTWGNARTRSVGPLWAYLQRVRWWRCGSGQDLVGEFVVTDPIPFRIINAIVTLRDQQEAA
ncbi:MAG: hypothetical protein NTY02_05025 [Acidobacteria bacterium]|nr:hypothetical protein [Acidobacteriota bacterium]